MPDKLLYKKYWNMIRRQHQIFHRILEKVDLYPGQPPVLSVLDRKEGISQKDLAEKIFVSPSTLAIMIDRMEKKGLIIREKDSKDRRVKNVFLSEKGVQKRDIFNGIMKDVNRLYFNDFSREEEIQFISFIDKILNNIDTMQSMERENKC